MNRNYTVHNQSSTYEYYSIDDIDDAVAYLIDPNSFRPFNKGLIDLLKKKGYSGDIKNNEALSDFLILRLRKINSSIKNKTVCDWITGTHRPKIENGSRKRIYEICFALELSYDETLWFFHHVYYDRAFNCHTLEEAVYYFSFLHHLTYAQAQEIILEIQNKNTPTCTINSHEFENYTQFVKNCMEKFQSVAELKEFLLQNKDNFNSWNKSALKKLNNLVTELIGPPESKDIINKLKRIVNPVRNYNKKIQSFDLADYKDCGLVFKELLFDAQDPNQCTAESLADYVFEAINGKNTQSNTFILERILRTTKICRNKEIPDIIYNNFPSRKKMSDILSEDKISTSKSYDSIRKMIVLLDFYRFWVTVKLGIGYTELSTDELCEAYMEESNACLYQCGYENLYAGNPYDWIFLCSARSEEPLEYFRALIGELSGED